MKTMRRPGPGCVRPWSPHRCAGGQTRLRRHLTRPITSAPRGRTTSPASYGTVACPSSLSAAFISARIVRRTRATLSGYRKQSGVKVPRMQPLYPSRARRSSPASGPGGAITALPPPNGTPTAAHL